MYIISIKLARKPQTKRLKKYKHEKSLTAGRYKIKLTANIPLMVVIRL